jgi:hypothetical protein
MKSSNEDLRGRIQIFDQQNGSPSLQSFPASTSLAMMTVDSIQQENAGAEMPKTVSVGGKASSFSFFLA